MKVYVKILLLAVLFLGLVGISGSNLLREVPMQPGIDSLFSGPQAMGTIENASLDEISGLAVSRSNPAYLWAHNDSGDDPRIFLFDRSGRHKGVFYFKNAFFRDVEDMAVGPGPEADKSYLYIADFGDNLARHDTNIIFRVEEPDVRGIEGKTFQELDNFQRIKYVYPDGQRDAEAIIVDPSSGDIYIFSKREPEIHIYKLPFPQDLTEVITAEKIGSLDVSMVVAADLAANGQDLLIKTYRNVYYWHLQDISDIKEISIATAYNLPYAREPQGEAIAWDTDGNGYFTASEEMKIFDSVLYFYERLDH